MKTIILAFLLGISILISCNKNDQECVEAQYNQLFKIEAGESYCFDDGNYIEIQGLGNGFCPCFANCIWEGEMLMNYQGEFDGNFISGILGSSPKTNSFLIENKYSVYFGDIELEGGCSDPGEVQAINHAFIEIIR